MTDSEMNEKIHRILKHIVVDNVTDSRMVGKHYSQWNFREFKEIEYNEYITRGLFEILLKAGIATAIASHNVKLDNERAKTAYFLETYLPKEQPVKKSKWSVFWDGIAHGNNLFGLFLGIAGFVGVIWGSIVFLRSCG